MSSKALESFVHLYIRLNKKCVEILSFVAFLDIVHKVNEQVQAVLCSYYYTQNSYMYVFLNDENFTDMLFMYLSCLRMV